MHWWPNKPQRLPKVVQQAWCGFGCDYILLQTLYFFTENAGREWGCVSGLSLGGFQSAQEPASRDQQCQVGTSMSLTWPDLTYDLTCMIWSYIHQSQSDFYHVILEQTTVILFQFRKCNAGRRYSGFQFYATGSLWNKQFGPFSYTMTEATNSWFGNWNDLWQASLGHYLCYKAEVIIFKVLCKRMP